MTLLELFHLLRKHLKLVVALPLACAVGMAIFSFAFMGNTYTASTSMYVLAQRDDATSSSLSTDLSASQMISNDVSTLLTSDRVLDETAADLGLEDLDDCVAAAQELGPGERHHAGEEERHGEPKGREALGNAAVGGLREEHAPVVQGSEEAAHQPERDDEEVVNMGQVGDEGEAHDRDPQNQN